MDYEAGSCDIAGTKQPDMCSKPEVTKCLQVAAANAGKIAEMEQLFLETGCWWPEAADAAFNAGQLHTFWWMRTYKPPCP